MRSTMGNADGNYGPLTRGGDACGSPPGTPKKVLAYNGDGSDLRGSQAGSGPYWVDPRETDASCSFAAGDKVNAYVYISGNHGGTAKWEVRKLLSGDGVVGDADFQMIPGALWSYGPDGPSEFSKPLGAHTETFILPSDLEHGWHTLRWNWIAPGDVQFVHCVEVQIDRSSMPPSPVPMPTPTQPAPTPMPVPSPRPPMSRLCVPTLDAPFDDARIYEPVCSSLGNANTCPGPLCRWSAGRLSAFTAVEVGKRRSSHQKSQHFLGPAFVQEGIIVEHGSFWVKELSPEEGQSLRPDRHLEL